MYIVTTTFERLSASTEYFIDTQPALKEQFVNFVNRPDLPIVDLLTVDQSDLVQVTTAVYIDEPGFQVFADMFAAEFPTFMDDRDAYCAANNITVTRTIDNE